MSMHVFAATSGTSQSAVTLQRRRRGHLGLQVTCAASVERGAEGELIDFEAADRTLLARFVHDFENYLRAGSDSSNHVARVYEAGGSGARDPRTGAVIARYRDALAGRLDPLLEAFRASE